MRDRFDSLSRMASARAPVLVLRGARDTVVPPAMGLAISGAARGADDATVGFVRRHVGGPASPGCRGAPGGRGAGG